jgi:hypothetical protein
MNDVIPSRRQPGKDPARATSALATFANPSLPRALVEETSPHQDAKISSSFRIEFPMTYEMRPASAGLEKVVVDSLRRAPVEQAPILAWPLACGYRVAERTRAVACVEGVLQVEVPDLGWRKELQSLAPRYLAAMNRYVRQDVNRIEFIVASKPK